MRAWRAAVLMHGITCGLVTVGAIVGLVNGALEAHIPQSDWTAFGAALLVAPLAFAWTLGAARGASTRRWARWTVPRAIGGACVLILVALGAAFFVEASFFSLSGRSRASSPEAWALAIGTIALALWLASTEILVIAGTVAAARRSRSTAP